MTPSISLEQLATKSKFTHKSQPKAHDSYMSEHIANQKPLYHHLKATRQLRWKIKTRY